MKRSANWISKNGKTILQFTILISCILIPTIWSLPPGKPETIASLISINLNGEINGDFQAQILIENITTLVLEENQELINIIKTDMNFLANKIQGLDRITIYNYSYFPLPGRVNLFLENVRYNEKTYLKHINSIVNADRSKWWYVEDFDFTPIVNEGETLDDAYNIPTGGDATIFTPYFYEPPQNYGDNVTLVSNETITASWWIIQDENWTFNEEFYHTLQIEILSLKEKIIGIKDLSISNFEMDETKFNLDNPIIYNLTNPIPYDFAYLLGEAWIRIDFTGSSTRTERNTVKKIVEKFIQSKWYFPSYAVLFFGEDDEFVRALTVIFVVTPVCILIGIITIVMLIRNFSKKY